MTFASDQQQTLKKSAYADQAASSFNHEAQSELLSFDRSSSSQQRTVPPADITYKASSAGYTDGRNNGSLPKALRRGYGVRPEIMDEISDENVTWVVKPPVRLRHNGTPAASARDYGDIKINVRLLGVDRRKIKKPRMRGPVKPPLMPSEGASHFKVYQVQRRGEQSAKLVAGRTISHTLKSVGQQPANHEHEGRGGTSPTNQERDSQFYSEKLSQPPSSHASLPIENVSRFEPELSAQQKVSSSAAETANKETVLRSEMLDIQRGGLAKEQPVVTVKPGREEKPNEACGFVSTLVSSVFASLNALCSMSNSHSAASVDGTQSHVHSPEQQQPAVSSEEHSRSIPWTTQAFPQYPKGEIPSGAQRDSQDPASNHKGEPSSSSHQPQPLEPTGSLIPDDRPSSCCAAMPCETGSAFNVRKLAYWQPLAHNAFLPATQRLPSPLVSNGGDGTTQAPGTSEISRLYLAQPAGCMIDFVETCGRCCAPGSSPAGNASDFEKRPEVTVQSHQVWVGETQTAPQQHSFSTSEGAASATLAGASVKPSTVTEGANEGGRAVPQPATQQQGLFGKMLTLERTPSKKFSEGNVRPSTETGTVLEDVDTSAHRITSTEKLSGGTSHSVETPSGKKEYAIFLPQWMRPEELGRDDEVPVIFRILQRRRARLEPRIRAEPSPVAPPLIPFKQVFHFRVLQQQQRRDEENRRLIAFKAPRHCRADCVTSSFPQQPLNAPSFLDCSYSCASPCCETAERLTSGSSTSSLVTLQYVHKRIHFPLPRMPANEGQTEPHEFLSKATESRSASQTAQETTRRVTRRRAARKAKAKARKPPKKKAEHVHDKKESPKKLRRFEKSQTYIDSLWCCAVRDECEEPQVISADDNETRAYSTLIQGKDIDSVQKESRPGTPRETDGESGASDEKSEVVDVQPRATEEAVSALRMESLCRRVGDWLTGRCRGRKGTRTNEEPRTDMPLLHSEDAVEVICSSRQAVDESHDQATVKSDLFSTISCCKPTTRQAPSALEESSSSSFTSDGYRDKTDSGQPAPLTTSTETVERMQPPRLANDYLRAAPGDVTPPLYSLPVVSFLPPVFEPLPVVETVSLCSPLQLPVCCFAVPPAPMQMWSRQPALEQRNFGSENGYAKMPDNPPASTNRVKICVLPAREPVARL